MSPDKGRGGLRTVYRPQDIERARENAERHTWARDVYQGIIEMCDELYGISPDALSALVPEKTPLVSGHCTECGAHYAGAEILERGEVLRCTGCQKSWRCEDPDRSEEWDLHGAMRSFRLRHLYLELDLLGLSFQLTGDRIYADRAAAVVSRFAEVFKGYRLNAIHRNVWLEKPHPYYGRIDGWKFRDGLCVSKMLLTYDLVRDSGAFSEADLVRIDTDLVRHAMDYFTEGFGPGGYLSCANIQDMSHSWESIALAATILDEGSVLASFHRLFRDLCGAKGRLVFYPEDGAFVQGSFSYAMQHLKPLTAIAEILRGRDGLDVYRVPECALLRKVYTWPLETTYPNRIPAAINDSHIGTWGCDWEVEHSQIAYYRLGDRQSLTRMREQFGPDLAKGNRFSLFHRPPEGLHLQEGQPYAESSSLLQGLRFGTLRHGPAKPDQTMAFLDFGRPMGHHHADFLNFGLWSRGMLMVTEMGYKYRPDWIRLWARSPLAHNLVLELGDHRATPATASVWFTGRSLHAIEAGLPGVVGRRQLALVPIGDHECYFVDLFWASAGQGTHTWAMHAAGDRIDTTDLGAFAPWPDPPEPLRNARRTTTCEPFSVSWSYSEGRALRTNLLDASRSEVALAECPSEEDFAARAFTTSGTRIEDVPFPYRSKILVKRTEAVSCFTAVHEPFQGDRILESTRRVPLQSGDGIALETTFVVDGRRHTDLFIQTRPGSVRKAVVDGVELVGRAGFVRCAEAGDGRAPISAVLMSGRKLRFGKTVLRSPRSANIEWP